MLIGKRQVLNNCYYQLGYCSAVTANCGKMQLSAAIVIVAIWNALLFPGFYSVITNKKVSFFGVGEHLAFGSLLAFSVALIVSEPVRNVVLKEGRKLDDIKTSAYFMILLSSLMLIMTSII